MSFRSFTVHRSGSNGSSRFEQIENSGGFWVCVFEQQIVRKKFTNNLQMVYKWFRNGSQVCKEFAKRFTERFWEQRGNSFELKISGKWKRNGRRKQIIRTRNCLTIILNFNEFFRLKICYFKNRCLHSLPRHDWHSLSFGKLFTQRLLRAPQFLPGTFCLTHFSPVGLVHRILLYRSLALSSSIYRGPNSYSISGTIFVTFYRIW